MKVKTLKKLLKKAGLKTSGKKTALTRRAKKARLLKGSGFLDMFRPKDPTKFDTSNPMMQGKIWKGSPEQKAARAERQESRLQGDTLTADYYFEHRHRNPEAFVDAKKKYLDTYGTKMFDQGAELIKDYIHHFYVHVDNLPEQPAKTPKQAKWEGSPEQITARAERLKDPNIAGTADHFFEQGKRNPKYLNDDDDGVNPIEKYLELYGTNLYDQKDDLVKDYIHHFYMHVAGRDDDLITIWEGSPEQIAARAERLESPTRADSIFVKAQRTPDYFPGLAESYLRKHGSKLFDQDPDLAKDYIQHNWLSPIKR